MADQPDLPALPTDEDGFIQTSAAYGNPAFVRVFYNTDPEGTWVEDDDWSNVTLHGPFKDVDEATAWMEAYPDGDRDLKDMDVITVNGVRPVTKTYTALDVTRIVNAAIDDIDEFVGGLPDEGVRDALNLLVNVVGSRTEKDDETLSVEDVIGTNYDADPDDVKGWIQA